jgi:hypothetical protein
MTSYKTDCWNPIHKSLFFLLLTIPISINPPFPNSPSHETNPNKPATFSYFPPNIDKINKQSPTSPQTSTKCKIIKKLCQLNSFNLSRRKKRGGMNIYVNGMS